MIGIFRGIFGGSFEREVGDEPTSIMRLAYHHSHDNWAAWYGGSDGSDPFPVASSYSTKIYDLVGIADGDIRFGLKFAIYQERP
jgi:hypothetical protein